MTMPDYRHGLEPLCEAGRLRPRSGRVLVRAILSSDLVDATGLIVGARHAVDAKQAIAHEVVEVAPDIPATAGLAKGMHCLHISATADPVDWSEKSCRFWLVHHEDIIAAWWPGDAPPANDDASIVDADFIVVPRT